MYVDKDDDETIYVADTWNYRIVEWKKNVGNGRIVAGGNGYGNRSDQLNRPLSVIVDHKNNSLIICDYGNQQVVRWSRQNGVKPEIIISNITCYDLAMDKNDYLYVSDSDKHEVRQWKIGENNGTVIAGDNGIGNDLNQFNGPRHIYVDQNDSVYISDHYNHRVMKWLKGATEGIIVAGGQGQGNNLTQLSNPGGIVVDQLENVYVADYDNDRVMRWLKDAREGTVIAGGNGKGQQANQFNAPIDLSFDQQNNLYVLEGNNNRVQKFFIESP